VEMLLDEGETGQARAVVTRLLRMKPAGTLVDYLTARLLLSEGQIAEAIRHLQNARKARDLGPDWAARGEIQLGIAHGQLGGRIGELDACRLAVAALPLDPSLRLALARVLREQGHLEEALAEDRIVVSLPEVPPAAWTELARCVAQRNAALPAARQDW